MSSLIQFISFLSNSPLVPFLQVPSTTVVRSLDRRSREKRCVEQFSTCSTIKFIMKFFFKGDRFELNVIDQLTDTTMFRSTSIVSGCSSQPLDFLTIKHNYSIGMEYFNTELVFQMVLLESLNVQLFLKIRSCIVSPSQTRQERFGTIHIIVSLLSSS